MIQGALKSGILSFQIFHLSFLLLFCCCCLLLIPCQARNFHHDPTSRANRISTFLKNSDLNSNFPQCKVGYIKGNSIANYSHQQLSSCVARGFHNRENLWKILIELENKNDSFVPLIKLFESLTSEHEITNLIFLGDSVSSQLFTFLLCDFRHSNYFETSAIQWINRSCQFCISYVDIWLIPSSSSSSSKKVLRLYNRQFNLPCLHDSLEGCDDPLQSEELSFKYIQRILHIFITHISHHQNFPSLVRPSSLSSSSPSLSSSSSPSQYSQQIIVIFNYGLHVLSPEIANWSLQGMIKGIVQLVKQLHRAINLRIDDKEIAIQPNITFLYRETSSQVFTSSQDGSYSSSSTSLLGPNHSLSSQSSSFCCQYPREISQKSNWRNELIQKYLDNSNSNWRREIGWISFYNQSLLLYDLRAESHKPNVVDCTHFIYLPTAYGSLWEEIQTTYLKLIKFQ